MGSSPSRPTFDASALLVEAEQLTKLSDWGDDQSFRIGLEVFADACRRYLFPEATDTKSLSKQDRDVLFQKCAGAALGLREDHDVSEMPPPGEGEIANAFAQVLDGLELAIPPAEATDE